MDCGRGLRVRMFACGPKNYRIKVRTRFIFQISKFNCGYSQIENFAVNIRRPLEVLISVVTPQRPDGQCSAPISEARTQSAPVGVIIVIPVKNRGVAFIFLVSITKEGSESETDNCEVERSEKRAENGDNDVENVQSALARGTQQGLWTETADVRIRTGRTVQTVRVLVGRCWKFYGRGHFAAPDRDHLRYHKTGVPPSN